MAIASGAPPTVIYVPSDVQPGERLPSIIFYPGTHMSPTVAPIRQFAGDRSFLLAGVGYLPEPAGHITSEEAARRVRAEIEALAAVRSWLVQKANADPNRVYLAGTSKVSWTGRARPACT